MTVITPERTTAPVAAAPKTAAGQSRSKSAMIVKYVLPLAALILFLFAVGFVFRSRQELPPPVAPSEPARNPFANAVAAAGMVEAETENIAVGTPESGIVTDVLVK